MPSGGASSNAGASRARSSPSPSNSATGDATSVSAAAAAAADSARKSQRQPLSCTECTRRKTRCNKIIPCENCIKRGKQSECRLEVTIKETSTGTRKTTAVAASQIDDLRRSHSALLERMTRLEFLFSHLTSSLPPGSFPSLASFQFDPTHPHSHPHFPSASEIKPEDTEDDLEADAAATLEFLAMGRSRAKTTGALIGQASAAGGTASSSRVSSDAGGGGDRDYSDDEEEGGDEGDMEQDGLRRGNSSSSSSGFQREETHHPPVSSSSFGALPPPSSAALEKRRVSFAATDPGFKSTPPISTSGPPSTSSSMLSSSMPTSVPTSFGQQHSNRSRAASSASAAHVPPPPPPPPAPPSAVVPPLAPPLPPHRLKSTSSIANPSFAPPLPSPALLQARPQKRRMGAMAALPDERIGRALVAYDVEHCAWMHCALHVPSFLEECDLFWSEAHNSSEVEVNRAWLALFFSVMLSALQHMPSSLFVSLFHPSLSAPISSTSELPSVRPLLEKYFDACLLALNEANWMGVHTLYSVQAVAILVSPANALGRSDVYFTMLAAAVKIAQTLNVNHLGPDSYPVENGSVPDSRALVVRELSKRVWFQLLIQDGFHLPHNRSCSISLRQFDTPPPLHCTDDSLLSPSTLRVLSPETPTLDSHTIQLVKFALLTYRMFDEMQAKRAVPYALVVSYDREYHEIVGQAPSWMRFDEAEVPLPVPDDAPVYLEWQRMVYLVSSAHKLLIIHRPYLGRSMRDDKFKQSRITSVKTARRILGYLAMCKLEEFRKTWTVLAHSVAACIVLIVDASHPGSPSSDQQPLQLVLETVEIFRALDSSIAVQGVKVLTSLIESQAELLKKRLSDAAGGGAGTGPAQGEGAAPTLKRKVSSSYGSTEAELERAIKVLRRSKSSSAANFSPTAVHHPAAQRILPSLSASSPLARSSGSTITSMSTRSADDHQQQQDQQQAFAPPLPHMSPLLGPSSQHHFSSSHRPFSPSMFNFQAQQQQHPLHQQSHYPQHLQHASSPASASSPHLHLAQSYAPGSPFNWMNALAMANSGAGSASGGGTPDLGQPTSPRGSWSDASSRGGAEDDASLLMAAMAGQGGAGAGAGAPGGPAFDGHNWMGEFDLSSFLDDGQGGHPAF